MPNNSFTNNSVFMELLRMQRASMSPRRRKATQKQPMKPWLYPYSIERQYTKQIKAFMQTITDRMTWEIKNNLERWIYEYALSQGRVDADIRVDIFPDEFRNLGDGTKKYVLDLLKNNNIRLMVTNIGMNTSDVNLKQWIKLTKGPIGMEFVPIESWETDVIAAWGETNYNLISTLPEEYIRKVNTLVSEGVQYGKTSQGMLEEMKKITDTFTKARPELIARDQVGKLNGALTQKRQEEADIDMYIWMTSNDERVRGKPGGRYPNAIPSHWIMQGKICRWDDPSVYSEDGINWKSRTSSMPSGHPGSAILCRCTAIPYFKNLIKKIDDEQINESTIR